VDVRRELDLKLGQSVTLALGAFVERSLPQQVTNCLREAQAARKNIISKGAGKGKAKGKAKLAGKGAGKGEGKVDEEAKKEDDVAPLLSYGPCQTPALFFCAHHDACQATAALKPPQGRVAVEVSVECLKPFEVWTDVLEEKSAQGDLQLIEKNLKLGKEITKPLAIKDGQASPAPPPPFLSVTHTSTTPIRGLERPLPMNTWALSEAASAVLGLTPRETMESAQWLYEHGLISYPRTDSSTYGRDFDVEDVLHGLAYDKSWVVQEIDRAPALGGMGVQQYAQRLLKAHMPPRTGVEEDEDGHAPITPIRPSHRWSTRDGGQHFPVYELVLRYFLASVSEDCLVTGNEVHFQAEADLSFQGPWKLRGLQVDRSGWMEVLPLAYGARDTGPRLQSLKRGDRLKITSVRYDRHPTPPPMSMAKLLELMKRHGIGTDASASKHVSTLLERGYAQCSRLDPETNRKTTVMLLNESWDESVAMERLWTIPGMQQLIVKITDVGRALVWWLWQHAQDLVLPSIRAGVEAACAAVARGDRAGEEVLCEKLNEFRRRYCAVVPLLLAPEAGAQRELACMLSERSSPRSSICRDIAQADLEALARKRARDVCRQLSDEIEV